MKRSAALEPLSHDHHASLQLAARIRRGLRAGADLEDLRREAVAHGRSELARHFEAEETLLVPVLREDLTQRMLREHADLRALVDDVERADDPAPALAAFADALAAHVRFEEREAFPAVEASAGAEVLADIERRLHGRGAS